MALYNVFSINLSQTNLLTQSSRCQFLFSNTILTSQSHTEPSQRSHLSSHKLDSKNSFINTGRQFYHRLYLAQWLFKDVPCSHLLLVVVYLPILRQKMLRSSKSHIRIGVLLGFVMRNVDCFIFIPY